MEVETAVRRMLVDQPTITGYVGAKPNAKVYKHSLGDNLTGTGGRAIVVRRSNGWATPERTNTQEYPLVVIECWADHSRNPAGEYDLADNVDNAYAVYRAVDPLMHAKRDVVWGGANGLLVVTSQRWQEPWHATASDAHGVGVIADAQSRLGAIGECAVVVLTYALQVGHGTAA